MHIYEHSITRGHFDVVLGFMSTTLSLEVALGFSEGWQLGQTFDQLRGQNRCCFSSAHRFGTKVSLKLGGDFPLLWCPTVTLVEKCASFRQDLFAIFTVFHTVPFPSQVGKSRRVPASSVRS